MRKTKERGLSSSQNEMERVLVCVSCSCWRANEYFQFWYLYYIFRERKREIESKLSRGHAGHTNLYFDARFIIFSQQILINRLL